MDSNVYKSLLNRPDLLHFIRMNPIWYRRLTRNPEQVLLLEEASKFFYGKTFYQKVGKISDNINLISLLLSMSDALQEQNE